MRSCHQKLLGCFVLSVIGPALASIVPPLIIKLPVPIADTLFIFSVPEESVVTSGICIRATERERTGSCLHPMQWNRLDFE
jgi:hypothetical protein